MTTIVPTVELRYASERPPLLIRRSRVPVENKRGSAPWWFKGTGSGFWELGGSGVMDASMLDRTAFIRTEASQARSRQRGGATFRQPPHPSFAYAAILVTFRPTKSRMAAPISWACVSSAKWPVSKNRTSAFGLSRLNASAPGGRKKGSFLPQTASSGGRLLRKYSWNLGYKATLL